jgi:hypothetical protein
VSAEDRLGPPLLDFHQEGEVKRACAQFSEIRLWDLFAAAALAGNCAFCENEGTGLKNEDAANLAAAAADALLAERRKREEQP